MTGEGRDGMEELIPENSTLAQRIRAAASKGTLSHAAILSGSGDRMAAARYFAAALECEGEGERPCLRCRQCRKVLEDIHPDVVTVRDDGHKELPVELVRQLRQDVYIRPNDGARKVYIFADCGQLNQRDQNVLLKIVEEGPAYAAFLFCAETAAALLRGVEGGRTAGDTRDGAGQRAVPGAGAGKDPPGGPVAGIAGEPPHQAGAAAGAFAGCVAPDGAGLAASGGEAEGWHPAGGGGAVEPEPLLPAAGGPVGPVAAVQRRVRL